MDGILKMVCLNGDDIRKVKFYISNCRDFHRGGLLVLF